MHSEPVSLMGGPLVAQCWCCGEPADPDVSTVDNKRTWRCLKHRDRNPCAIEGCSRSTAARGQLDAGQFWLCGAHWKIVCPPHSPQRRAFLRFFRLAKKRGYASGDRWDDELETRYWRYWHGLVRRGRRQIEDTGSIDVNEIHRMFGWDEPNAR